MERGEITYIYEFGEPIILFIYYINERKKRIVDSNLSKNKL